MTNILQKVFQQYFHFKILVSRQLFDKVVNKFHFHFYEYHKYFRNDILLPTFVIYHYQIQKEKVTPCQMSRLKHLRRLCDILNPIFSN